MNPETEAEVRWQRVLLSRARGLDLTAAFVEDAAGRRVPIPLDLSADFRRREAARRELRERYGIEIA